jgi:Fungal trichothecene efflux pump (TRI12)
LISALKSGKQSSLNAVPGINPSILAAVTKTSHNLYAHAYRLGYASIIPFVVLAIVASSRLKGVKDLMTEHVEATVEKVPNEKVVEA